MDAMVGFSLVGMGIYTLRFFFRKKIQSYEWVTEWLGHGVHPLIMILLPRGEHLMAMVFFLVCTGIFFYRVFYPQSRWDWEARHLLMSLAMAYSYSGVRIALIDWVFSALYIMLSLENITYLYDGIKAKDRDDITSSVGHIAISLAMVIHLMMEGHHHH